MHSLIALNFGASTGTLVLIWLVELVIYPGFVFVESGRIIEAQKRHMKMISWVVAPLVLCEMLLASLLLAHRPEALIVLNFTLSALALSTTLFYFAPLHERFVQSADSEVLKRIQRSNWIRTSLWSSKFIVALLLTLSELEFL